MPRIKHDRRPILQFIIRYKREHDGNSPTIREIMDDSGVTSSSAMLHILKGLEEQGSIHYGREGGSRSIQVVGGQWTFNG